jgi:hypothetical protein
VLGARAAAARGGRLRRGVVGSAGAARAEHAAPELGAGASEQVLAAAARARARERACGSAKRRIQAGAGQLAVQCWSVGAGLGGGERCGVRRWSDGSARVEAWQRTALVARRCADGAEVWRLEADPHGGQRGRARQ